MHLFIDTLFFCLFAQLELDLRSVMGHTDLMDRRMAHVATLSQLIT